MSEYRFGTDGNCVECGLPDGTARRIAELQAQLAQAQAELSVLGARNCEMAAQLVEAEAESDRLSAEVSHLRNVIVSGPHTGRVADDGQSIRPCPKLYDADTACICWKSAALADPTK